MRFILMFMLLSASAAQTAEDHHWILPDAQGKTHHFPQDAVAEQQVTVVLFWATWCPYCQQLMPHLQSMVHQYQSSINLKVFALNIHEDGDPVAYLRTNGYQFDLFPNAEPVAKQLAVHGTPVVLIYDQKGELVFDLRSLDSSQLVKQKASHGAKSVRLAPWWAAEIRKVLNQL